MLNFRRRVLVIGSKGLLRVPTHSALATKHWAKEEERNQTLVMSSPGFLRRGVFAAFDCACPASLLHAFGTCMKMFSSVLCCM